ncbi:iron chaperone [Microbacterium sp.]|uniref:iron chaperone n=1 Tax=Microbacterium sp. TaxID=51671 RepID=UPI0039E2E00D
MSTDPEKASADGFSEAERAAMKERAAELRAEGRQGAKKADGLEAVLDAIAKMEPADRALAERVHVAVTASAPELTPKTWYGMPAYANTDGKIVVAFKNSGKFNTRYSTLEFQDAARLDEGDIWPVSFALTTWNAAVERRVSELVRASIV